MLVGESNGIIDHELQHPRLTDLTLLDRANQTFVN